MGCGDIVLRINSASPPPLFASIIDRNKYYNDHIHVNADEGIRLYAKACVSSEVDSL